jgi:Resolvase, N terminal domain
MEDQLGVREEERRAQEDRASLPNLDRRQRSEPQKEEEIRLMPAAIYARVSTPHQGREQTIESQLAALKSWADENSFELSPENVYTDEGYSGSRLDRPGLDALRDGAEWSGKLKPGVKSAISSERVWIGASGRRRRAPSSAVSTHQ